ncbi:MAG: ABC-F family ATP-binding cassette domain-containing protein [Pseudomonadales bacterium]
MISAQAFGFERGEQNIFANCSFALHSGQRVGIVGRNGAGKSTLFALLLGELATTSGELTTPAEWRITHMAQEVAASARPALEFVIDGHRELRELEQQIAAAEAADDAFKLGSLIDAMNDIGGYQAEARAGQILYGLGFSKSDFNKPQQSFSGGWRIRLSLAQALMRPTDLLLLDEPTNHLDLEATVWLEDYLRQFDGTLLVIAHDREFLDNTTTHILHLQRSQATVYKGNYSAFESQRLAKLEQQQAQARKQAAEVEHIAAFVRRFRAKASKAKQVQSRVKALARMEQVAVMQQDSPYRLQFPNPDALSSPLLALNDMALGYEATTVLESVKASIMPGDRIGILGENGAGKSTLLKAIVGVLAPMQGEIVRGKHSSVGYFAQHQLETLHADITPLASYSQRFEASEQQARDTLGRWGFDGNMVTRTVGSLSGGEKARLVLALIAQEQPAVLVLDEPTNHLDLDMREALAMALQTFEGALLLVSHDRSLLERCVDQFWIVGGGAVARYADTVGDYAALIKKQRSAGPRAESGPASDAAHGASAGDALTAAERRKLAAAKRKELKPLRDQQRKLEKQMEHLSDRISAAESQLADPESYASMAADELDTLLKSSAKLRKELDDTEQAWLNLSEQLDELTAG